MTTIRVLLVDDHVALRAELRRLITSQPDTHYCRGRWRSGSGAPRRSGNAHGGGDGSVVTGWRWHHGNGGDRAAAPGDARVGPQST